MRHLQPDYVTVQYEKELLFKNRYTINDVDLTDLAQLSERNDYEITSEDFREMKAWW